MLIGSLNLFLLILRSLLIAFLGCDQKHEEEIDPEAIYKDFVLRVSSFLSCVNFFRIPWEMPKILYFHLYWSLIALTFQWINSHGTCFSLTPRFYVESKTNSSYVFVFYVLFSFCHILTIFIGHGSKESQYKTSESPEWKKCQVHIHTHIHVFARFTP